MGSVLQKQGVLDNVLLDKICFDYKGNKQHSPTSRTRMLWQVGKMWYLHIRNGLLLENETATNNINLMKRYK